MNQYFADNEPVQLRGNKSVVGYGVMEGRLLIFFIECLESVSYTHLDVYKRQNQYS